MDQREQKKNQFAQQPVKKGKAVWIVVAVAIIGVALGAFFGLEKSSNAGLISVSAVDGKISVPVAAVSDGKAHYFTFDAEGQPVTFFLLKSSDGQIRAALNACDVCYKSLKGYRQEGDFMVCNNCNQQFESAKINEIKGGCNPAPLTREIINGQVVLHESELLSGRAYFPRS